MSHDSQLQHAVLAELAWEPAVEAAHIGVSAQDGVVSLDGHVDSYVEKAAAEAAARRVKGVRAVAEKIEVRLPSGAERSDEVIAAAIVERLAWDVLIPRDGVKATVEGGWVTLDGEVGWRYQAEAAEYDVGRLYGVRGVSNRISIRPRVDVSRISDDIVHALNRSWFFDPKMVFVTARGGTVHLTGTVKAPHDRQAAAAVAWAAPGVTEVVNDIVIA